MNVNLLTGRGPDPDRAVSPSAASPQRVFQSAKLFQAILFGGLNIKGHSYGRINKMDKG
jgi:hypothetical protein